MKKEKTCPECGVRFFKRTINCSAKCYHSSSAVKMRMSNIGKDGRGRPKSLVTRARISKSLAGKPKPWNIGDNNPNWEAKAHAQPGVRERMIEAPSGEPDHCHAAVLLDLANS